MFLIVLVIVKNFDVDKYDLFFIRIVLFGVVFMGKDLEDIVRVKFFNVKFG